MTNFSESAIPQCSILHIFESWFFFFNNQNLALENEKEIFLLFCFVFFFLIPEITSIFFSTPLATEGISDYYIFQLGSPWITALSSEKFQKFIKREVSPRGKCFTFLYAQHQFILASLHFILKPLLVSLICRKAFLLLWQLVLMHGCRICTEK